MITIQNRPLIIRTNYGDESIALTQWAFEAGLKARVVYIDTGWAADSWSVRINLGEKHAVRCGFEVVHLTSKISFADAIQGRGEFPSVQFQWCTGLLKGLPFLDWLEPIDLAGDAIILIAKRKAAAISHLNLTEWIERCQYHNDRTVWHPILEITTLERDGLLQRAGLVALGHRSLECDPCVNSSCQDLKRLASVDQQKKSQLEIAVGCDWILSPPVDSIDSNDVTNRVDSPKTADSSAPLPLDLFYRGCGNHFGCGL